MTKKDLINTLSKETRLKKENVSCLVNNCLRHIEKALKRGEQISILGFGKLLIDHRAARTGRNPQTGKPINIPAKKVVKFKPSTKLNEAINQ